LEEKEMDRNHPKNVDPRPKRRRGKDNPYEIFTARGDTGQPQYNLSFTDGGGVRQCMEISKTLFDAFDRFELDDLSFLNEVDNHYEHSELTEASLNARAAEKAETVEETAIQHLQSEQLHRAIERLPDKQRRRLVLYYFGELTYEQIAKVEGCTISPIKRSIDEALKNLKNFLK